MRVTLEQLKSLAGTVQEETKQKQTEQRSDSRVDVRAYAEHHGIEIIKEKTKGTATLYCLKECPFDPSHAPNESAIVQADNGALTFQCFHNSCQGRTWQEARFIISGNDKLTPFMVGGNSGNKQSKTDTTQAIENTEFVSLSDIYTVQQTDKQDILTRLQPWNDIIDSSIQTEYLLDRLIPKGSITLEFGRGGIGKTTLTMDIGYAIAEGITFAELSTIKTPVYYIDFENPLSFVKDRASFIGRTDNMWFWHISNEIPPPRFDSKEWVLYKELPPGLLIIDSLRSSQLMDENSSKDMALILCRLKELREMGFTIVLLAHTPKGSDAIYKGSTAILDLSDHILGFQMVKDSGDEVVEFDPSQLFIFGTRIKTRYEPAQIYLNFDPSIKRFTQAEDPDCENLRTLWNYLKTRETPPNQSEFREQGTKIINVADAEIRRLISKGTGLCWTVGTGEKNAKLYHPNAVCQFVSPYALQTNKQPEKPSDKQTPIYTPTSLDNTKFVSLSGGIKQTNKQEENQSNKQGISILDPSTELDIGDIPVTREAF
jgi:archaellum biogenesis ATPase FlaH